MRKVILTSVLALFASLVVFAQGTLSGTIIDEKYVEPLIGANVILEGTAIGTSTDFDGKYQFPVEAGTYTIVVSYTGYTNKRIEDVVIKDGEVTYLDVSLSDEAIDLGLDVVVKAKAIERSENALLMLQRKSDKIQDGISAQEMNRFSVSTAASAMKKVTGATVSGGKYIYIRGLGDRYSLSQLNGLIIPSTDPYRNSAQLDLIPSNLLENIITAKTFTPDQPGTFTGGNVDIKTKSFPEQMTFTVSLSTSYNSQNHLIDNFLNHNANGNDYFGYSDGSRDRPALLDDPSIQEILNTQAPLLARLNLGGQGQSVAERADRAIKAMNNNFVPFEDNTPVDHGISVAFGNQYQMFGKPLGVILSGSFKQQYLHLGNFQKANWILQDQNSGTLLNQGDFLETNSTISPTVSGMAGLAYKLSDFNSVTFNLIYNHNTTKTSRTIEGERPDNILLPDILQGRNLVFNERELINYQLGGKHVFPGINNAELEWKASLANSTMSEPDTRFFENQFNTELGSFSIPASNVQRPFHFFRDLEDEQVDFKVDLTIPITQVKANKLKFGTLITQKERTFSEFRYQVEEHIGYVRPFNGDPVNYMADDNRGIVDVSDDGTRYFLGNYLTNRTEARNNYEGSDDVTAFYGMATLQVFPKLKVIAGARYERTEIFVESADANRGAGVIDTSDVLPSFNLVYSLGEKMNLRGGYNTTLARPNMREIAPFEAFDPLTTELYLGNPELDRTRIKNYDLRWEWFINPGEILAVSAYYKNFDAPITQFYRRAPSPEIQFTNVEQAELYGIEFEFRKDLGTLGTLFQNFKLNTNLSFIESSMDVVEVTNIEPEDRPFEGQPTFILNAALIYEDQETGWDAVLALNSIGDRLNIIGREGTPDIYDRGRTQLDFNISKTIGNSLDVKFSAQNLLDDRFLISSEYQGNEFVYSRFRRGITFGLGLTFRIR
jgi:outer membrane receptor protein involved in Fe transport